MSLNSLSMNYRLYGKIFTVSRYMKIFMITDIYVWNREFKAWCSYSRYNFSASGNMEEDIHL